MLKTSEQLWQIVIMTIIVTMTIIVIMTIIVKSSFAYIFYHRHHLHYQIGELHELRVSVLTSDIVVLG